ncbi:hypothetical protein HDE_09330 [Halotydeus destructor]|nr:hypothetical protein HDE_09330 [Halotydeus destructor]
MRTVACSVLITLLICVLKSTYAAPRQLSQNETECNILLLQTDKCIQRAMLVGQKTVDIPRTADQLVNGHCKRVEKDIPCMRSYGARCLRTLPRTMFTIGYKQATKLYKRICSEPEGQKEYLRHVQCMQPHQLHIVHQYMDLVTTYMDYIHENVTLDEIIPYICCSYFKVFEDAKHDLKQFCQGEDTVDFFLNQVRSLSSDMIDIGCGKYATVQSCEDNLPQAMKVFSDLGTPLSKVQPKDYSPVVPAIKIIKRLDLD